MRPEEGAVAGGDAEGVLQVRAAGEDRLGELARGLDRARNEAARAGGGRTGVRLIARTTESSTRVTISRSGRRKTSTISPGRGRPAAHDALHQNDRALRRHEQRAFFLGECRERFRLGEITDHHRERFGIAMLPTRAGASWHSETSRRRPDEVRRDLSARRSCRRAMRVRRSGSDRELRGLGHPAPPR